MTRQSSFKRLVRGRMDKTGESYTAARAKLLAAESAKAAEGPALTMSDAAIRRRTGRGWEEWLGLLDEHGAARWPHREIARWLREERDVPGWDAQSVAVSFERARGLRAVGERPGGFSVTAQKTVAAPVGRLYDAFVDEGERARWLPDGRLRERTATRPKSARYDWGDGETRVIVGFEAQGDAKSRVALEHERLPDGEQAERMKAFWRKRLVALKEQVESATDAPLGGGAPSVPSRDGTPIAFERRGDGPPLVLVDGALCSRAYGPLNPLAELLAPDFAVYRYDRRGRGDSGDTQPYAVEREVEDLAAVIDAAGDGPALVFGMSSGAALALDAAAAGVPIARLALYEPPFAVAGDPDESDAFAERIEQLIAAGRRGDAVELFLSGGGVPPDQLAELRRGPSWSQWEAVAPTLVYDNAVLGDGVVPRERAAGVEVPTLVAHGDDSPAFFGDAAAALAAALPDARLRVLAGQAWGRVEPAALAPPLREFLG